MGVDTCWISVCARARACVCVFPGRGRRGVLDLVPVPGTSVPRTQPWRCWWTHPGGKGSDQEAQKTDGPSEVIVKRDVDHYASSGT